MRMVNESELEEKIVEGDLGSAVILDALDEEIVAGVRSVGPMSKVPAAPHRHKERQIIYLISGKAWVTNGSVTVEMNPGDFVFLDEEEEHYVTTEREGAKIFEIKYP